ncbi:autotransporter domain-containing protein [uncultured Phascolarctobacterium sp.]|uniref:autotransporter domain-containing protein n=1 Tax=uncultured Phascolarctobacterium sp. TaxID=512296 RepID=UPI00345CE319
MCVRQSASNSRADIKGTSLESYGTWHSDNGQYLDLIAKYTRLENEFDVSNAYG